jgi:hypothetical protein
MAFKVCVTALWISSVDSNGALSLPSLLFEIQRNLKVRGQVSEEAAASP